MVLRPWFNSEGKPLLIDGAPVLCEECPCDPLVDSPCCVPAYFGPVFLRVPASKLLATCTSGSPSPPYLSDLIVEVNGFTSVDSGFCPPNGPYQVEQGGGSHACVWTGTLPVFDSSGCDPGFTWETQVQVEITAGGVSGLARLLRNGATVEGAQFSLTPLPANPFEFTGSLDIPWFAHQIGLSAAWDTSIPLTIYFA